MFVLSPGTECSLYTTIISIRSIPRHSTYTAKQDSNCLTPAELKELACQAVETALQASFSCMFPYCYDVCYILSEVPCSSEHAKAAEAVSSF
jgi:hypothetical protein